MLTVINTRLGENRGVPRVWLEGSKLSSNFQIGQKLDIQLDHEKKVAVLKVAPEGRFSVSKRDRNGRIFPLIEIKDDELGEMFGDVGVLLRVVVKNGVATIEVHGIDRKTAERVDRFNRKVKNGEALTIGSLFSGGGIIDAALHEGLTKAGINCYTKFIVEQERQYLDTMVANQPELFRDDSILIESGIEFVELKNPPKVDVLVAGVPCVGASKAGVSKNKISAAEFHESAGACFFHALQFIGQCQPGLIILENVPEYLSSTSMAVIKSVLETWGYELEVDVLNGNEFGCLENRDRMCVVATTKGMAKFNMELVKPLLEKPNSVSEILEDVPLDDSRWKTYQYLVDKEVRDKKAGKGFKRALLDGTESSVPTIRRLYHKAGSTDTFVKHPDGVLTRLFTPSEHAALKGVPVKLIHGVSATVSHEILGQGVCYPVFTAVGFALGKWASKASNDNDMLKTA